MMLSQDLELEASPAEGQKVLYEQTCESDNCAFEDIL